jgi:putative addiction module component (TIGR02574 family)
VNPTAERLLNAALGLPPEDREELAEALVASLPLIDPPFNDEWREEIARRTTEFKAGKVQAIP